MHLYIVKDQKVQLSELDRTFSLYPGRKIAQCTFAVSPIPTSSFSFQEAVNQLDPTYPFYYKLIQFLIDGYEKEPEITIQFINTAHQLKKSGNASKAARMEEDRLQIKLTGNVLSTVHSVFGNHARMIVEISKARTVDSPSSPEIGFATFASSILSMNQHHWPTPTSQSLSTSSTNTIECTTIGMKFFGVPAHCSDTIVIPANWQSHWNNSGEKGKRLTTEISIILSIVESDKHDWELCEVRDVNKSLLCGKIATDLEILTADGKIVLCHGGFLSAQSEVMKKMLECCASGSKGGTKRIVMDDMSEGRVNALLAYLYCRDTGKARESSMIAVELLQGAQKYMIDKLESEMKSIIVTITNTEFVVDAALALYFYAAKVGNSSLKRKAIAVLKSKPRELQGSEQYKKLFHEDPKGAQEISSALLF